MTEFGIDLNLSVEVSGPTADMEAIVQYAMKQTGREDILAAIEDHLYAAVVKVLSFELSDTVFGVKDGVEVPTTVSLKWTLDEDE